MILLDCITPYVDRYTDTSRHAGIRVIAHLRGQSPVGAYQAPHLSGLIARAVIQEATMGALVPDSSEPYVQPLPLARLWEDDHGVPFWAASAMTPLGEAVRDVVYLHKRAQSGGWTETARGWRIDTNKGRYMERRVPAPVEIAPAWVGYAYGDKEEVLRLLGTYITHLGRKRSIGWGEVERWEVESMPCAPWDAVLLDGVLLADAPEAAGLSAPEPARLLGWSPPYWLPALWGFGWPAGTTAVVRSGDTDWYAAAGDL